VKALTVIAELQLPVAVLICNNGGSVSLQKQGIYDEVGGLDDFLSNPQKLDYTRIAAGYGIDSERIIVDAETPQGSIEELARRIHAVTRERRPCIVELVLPNSLEFWNGVWSTAGLEDMVLQRAEA
jgi:thiamine pyrophosphate-dependent acetolactate synthase large subunit-like protein